MADSVNLNRQVFDRDIFYRTVDTNFSQLGPQDPDPTFFDIDLATIEDFFTLYNKFFFEIPKNGDINSHLFLIKESSNYINYRQTNEDIEALLEEIAQLRQENLDLRNETLQIIQSLTQQQTPITESFEPIQPIDIPASDFNLSSDLITLSEG
jgi:hypothetical protein